MPNLISQLRSHSQSLGRREGCDGLYPHGLSSIMSDAADEIEQLQESEESAWGLIANAYGGDWDLASEASGWKKAAERWRDNYQDNLTHLDETNTKVELVT